MIDRAHSRLSYQPDHDQIAFAEQVAGDLERMLPLSRLHTSPSESAATWALLEELGIFTISLSEERHGSGLSSTEEALIAIVLGRQLVSPAILATLGAVPFKSAALATPFRVGAAYRHAGRSIRLDEPGLSFALVRGEDAAWLIATPEGADDLGDEELWLSRLQLLHSPQQLIAEADGWLLLRLRLLDAAALAGVAEAALNMSLTYVAQREQFGRPIGSFQAVKHHCANMAVAARRARDQTTFAAIALSQDRADCALQIDCAYLIAASAALDNAGLNIQLHGALGFSDEADPQLPLKRARLYVAVGGDIERTAERIGVAPGAL